MHIESAVLNAVRAYQAKKENKGEENLVGNFQKFYPDRNEGQIQHEEHDISDVHAGDESPEKIRMTDHE